MIEHIQAPQLLMHRTYLLRVDQQATFFNNDAPFAEQRLTGEAALQIVERGEDVFVFSLKRLGFVANSVTLNGLDTGRISIDGQGGDGKLQRDASGWRLELAVSAQVIYEEITRQMGYERVGEDTFATPSEVFAGILSGQVLHHDGDSDQPLLLEGADLTFDYLEGGLGLIHRITLPLSVRLDLLPDLDAAPDVPALQLPPPPGIAPALPPAPATPTPGPLIGDAAAGCAATREKHLRRLSLQMVFLSGDDAAPPNSVANAAVVFESAYAIWGQACIELLRAADKIVSDAGLPAVGATGALAEAYAAAVAALFTPDDQLAIPVFVVPDRLDPIGGGVTFDGGTALAKVVISRGAELGSPPTLRNPQLLAHELGHVFLGLHLTDNARAKWWFPPDNNTVLTPSGSVNLRNPARNPDTNCRQAYDSGIAVLVTGNVPCCLDPAA